MKSICLITGDINFDSLVQWHSPHFFCCRVTVFPFVMNKCLGRDGDPSQNCDKYGGCTPSFHSLSYPTSLCLNSGTLGAKQSQSLSWGGSDWWRRHDPKRKLSMLLSAWFTMSSLDRKSPARNAGTLQGCTFNSVSGRTWQQLGKKQKNKQKKTNHTHTKTHKTTQPVLINVVETV